SGGARFKSEATVSIGRYTTLGAGGPAKALAKPTSLEEIEESLTWARRHDLPVAVVGVGSNLLVADEGVDALVLKLGGELTSAEVRGALLIAGGGAANAVCLHRVRAAGLGGLEFACAVRMTAGPYGSAWAATLVRALVVDASGAPWRTPAELGLSYRHSALGPGEVVARAEFRLKPRDPAEIKARVGELQALRKAA